MSRLIDLDEVKKRAVKVTIYDEGGWDVTCKAVPEEELDKLPTIEAEPVRHGRWEHGYNNGQYGIWCSECRAGFAYSDIYEVIAARNRYCPNCGTKMDKEE